MLSTRDVLFCNFELVEYFSCTIREEIDFAPNLNDSTKKLRAIEFPSSPGYKRFMKITHQLGNSGTSERTFLVSRDFDFDWARRQRGWPALAADTPVGRPPHIHRPLIANIPKEKLWGPRLGNLIRALINLMKSPVFITVRNLGSS